MSNPQLYLITPPVADTSALVPRLHEALAALPVACVRARVATEDEATAKRIVRALVEVAVRYNAALIVEEDARLAARAGADGVHCMGIAGLVDAVASLKPERIVGCGGLVMRDDAMVAAEHNIDYVMFGDLPDATASETLERTEWWAEIFNVPCVAVAEHFDEVAALAQAGADFVALGACVWDHPDGPAAALRAAAAAIDLRVPS